MISSACEASVYFYVGLLTLHVHSYTGLPLLLFNKDELFAGDLQSCTFEF